jgi:hypothetical protein
MDANPVRALPGSAGNCAGRRVERDSGEAPAAEVERSVTEQGSLAFGSRPGDALLPVASAADDRVVTKVNNIGKWRTWYDRVVLIFGERQKVLVVSPSQTRALFGAADAGVQNGHSAVDLDGAS